MSEIVTTLPRSDAQGSDAQGSDAQGSEAQKRSFSIGTLGQLAATLAVPAALVAIAASFDLQNEIHRHLLLSLSILGLAFYMSRAQSKVTRTVLTNQTHTMQPFASSSAPTAPSIDVQRAEEILEGHFKNRINDEKLKCLSSVMRTNTRSDEADRAVMELEQQRVNAQQSLAEARASGSENQVLALVQQHLGQ